MTELLEALETIRSQCALACVFPRSDPFADRLKPDVENPNLINEAQWKLLVSRTTGATMTNRESFLEHFFVDAVVKSTMGYNAFTSEDKDEKERKKDRAPYNYLMLYALESAGRGEESSADITKLERQGYRIQASNYGTLFHQENAEIVVKRTLALIEQLRLTLDNYSLFFGITPEQIDSVNLTDEVQSAARKTLEGEAPEILGSMRDLSLIECLYIRKHLILPALLESVKTISQHFDLDLVEMEQKVIAKIEDCAPGQEYIRRISPEAWKSAKAEHFLSSVVPEELQREYRKKLGANGKAISEHSNLTYLFAASDSEHVTKLGFSRIGEVLEYQAELAPLAEVASVLLLNLKQSDSAVKQVQERRRNEQEDKQRNKTTLYEFYPAAGMAEGMKTFLRSAQQVTKDYNLLWQYGEEAARVCGCYEEYKRHQSEHGIKPPAELCGKMAQQEYRRRQYSSQETGIL